MRSGVCGAVAVLWSSTATGWAQAPVANPRPADFEVITSGPAHASVDRAGALVVAVGTWSGRGGDGRNPEWERLGRESRLRLRCGFYGKRPYPGMGEGIASTSPDKCVPARSGPPVQPAVWRWERHSPYNWVGIRTDDWGGGGGDYCPFPGWTRVTKDIALASLLVHEGKHTEQDGEQPQRPPAGTGQPTRDQVLSMACAEVEAYSSQIAFIERARWFMTLHGIIEQSDATWQQLESYLEWLRDLLAHYERIKRGN